MKDRERIQKLLEDLSGLVGMKDPRVFGDVLVSAGVIVAVKSTPKGLNLFLNSGAEIFIPGSEAKFGKAPRPAPPPTDRKC